MGLPGSTVPHRTTCDIPSSAHCFTARQLVTNPLWVAKTRLQTQHMELKWRRPNGPMYTGAFNTLWRMAREEGLHGLYRSGFRALQSQSARALHVCSI